MPHGKIFSLLNLRVSDPFQVIKPKGLKVAKEDQRLIGSMVDRLDGW